RQRQGACRADLAEVEAQPYQPPEYLRAGQAGYMLLRVAQLDHAQRRPRQHLLAVVEERPRLHRRALDEAAAELVGRDVRGGRFGPRLAPLRQQVPRALQEAVDLGAVSPRLLPEAALDADQLGPLGVALLAALQEPVGVDQARGVVLGVGADVVQEA